MSSVNEFADVPCALCRKVLYSRQRCKSETPFRADHLSSKLVELSNLVVRTRYSSNIKNVMFHRLEQNGRHAATARVVEFIGYKTTNAGMNNFIFKTHKFRVQI